MNNYKKINIEIPRVIGTYSSGLDGPLLFITAGIHGNEPSGLRALQKVFEILEAEKPKIKGRVIGVSGNRAALQQGVRFIDEDLNRTWTVENIKNKIIDSHEKKEMFEIIEILNQYPEEEFTKRYFLDCHTTSSASAPYISVQEVNDNDVWAHQFPTHIIRGFSDIVLGCIDHYESRIGITGFVFEGGQHESKVAEMNHEGIIWLALVNACKLDLEKLSHYPEAAAMLLDNKKKQKTFEISYRHGLAPEDEFRMEAGYSNFQPIKKGELLAYQNGKPVYSKWDAYIFMPLYQKQGNDGFFVATEANSEPSLRSSNLRSDSSKSKIQRS
ncbi:MULTISPECIES: succinylglutamate desuccinylase/aspartoacylase family protein [Aequorivita]|uniref:Succinylglutamate desuccinylase/aspartoacylase family protein n=1 Tax=Aequorivita iocasae TaxID=2803865 RepID=A0ABX7DQF0_9FLAO|nr:MULTISPECIES: succinylglutamate desuccinylase/aspartoacylase family protein [Aequorivita]QQX75773.1 succinylglutamate desuccinylase/aspartoacylase family protein [Aequorivita iocasae]UCA55233.1 succinylglutamate desuccinylase/aspartoacylase family protein [Aequorivita sp. F7]